MENNKIIAPKAVKAHSSSFKLNYNFSTYIINEKQTNLCKGEISGNESILTDFQNKANEAKLELNSNISEFAYYNPGFNSLLQTKIVNKQENIGKTIENLDEELLNQTAESEIRSITSNYLLNSDITFGLNIDANNTENVFYRNTIPNYKRPSIDINKQLSIFNSQILNTNVIFTELLKKNSSTGNNKNKPSDY